MLSGSKNDKNKGLERSLLGKEKRQRGSWTCFMLCCPETDEEIRESPKKALLDSATRSTNHYTLDTNSFVANTLKQRNPSTRIFANNSTLYYPKDTAFILRKGAKRIISKVFKAELERIVPNERNDLLGSGRKSVVASGDTNPSLVGHSDTYDFTRQEVFSLYHRGIQIDKDDWSEVTPECVARHIAKKLKGKFIIDALCGYGGNTIQFAKVTPCVIGVEINAHKLKKAKHNANVYGVGDTIEFINGNFFALKKLKADVVFLAPSELPVEPNQKFSLESHLSPSLPQLIRHSLKLASSLCIKLPPYTCVDELAAIFSDIYHENPEEYASLNYTMQIDLLYIHENLVSIVVYFGGENKICAKEQKDLIYEIISMSENRNSNDSYTESQVHQLLEYVGLYRSLNMISDIEESLAAQVRNDESILNVFLKQLIEKKLLSNEILTQVQRDLYDSLGISSEKSKSSQSFGLGLLGNEKCPTLEDPPELGSLPSMKKLTKLLSVQNSLKSGPQELGLDVLQTDTHLSSDPCKTAPGKTIPLHLTTKDAKSMSVLSFETSEMALSNYSLKSEAMLDSYSDNYGEYILSMDEEIDDKPEVRSRRETLRKMNNDTKLMRWSIADSNGGSSPKSNKLKTSHGSRVSRKSKQSAVAKRKYS